MKIELESSDTDYNLINEIASKSGNTVEELIQYLFDNILKKKFN